MDYFSQLANMGGLASQYEGDLAQRANEITENTSLQENYNQVQDQFKNAQSAFQQGLAQWNYISEGDQNQGIDELKQWGIEVGSEFVASKVGGLYAGSALQKSIGGLYDAGTGYVKSAFQSALQTGKDTLQGAVEKGTELVNNAITEGTNTAQTLLEQGTSTVKSAITDGTSALSSAQQTAQDFVRSGQQSVQEAVGGAQQTVQEAVGGAQQTVQDAVGGGASDFANPAFGMDNPVSAEDTEADFTNPTFYGGGQSVGNTQQMFNNPLFDEASAFPDMTLGTETATTAYRSTAPYLAEQAPAEAPAVGSNDMMNSLLAENARPAEQAPAEQTAETPAPAEPAPTESTSNLTTVEDANQTVENTNQTDENTFNTEENTYNSEETTYKSELNTYENPDVTTPDADPEIADPLEDLGEDAVVDTATAGFGVGEALMAGQLLYTGVKALWDVFDPPKPPPPPTAPTVPTAPIYQQVQALPSYIQASAQSGV